MMVFMMVRNKNAPQRGVVIAALAEREGFDFVSIKLVD
jgi:hypothetical protein